jgi:pyruvate kinase
MTVDQEARLQENREVHTKIGKTWFIDIDGTILKAQSNEKIDRMISQFGNKSHTQEQTLPSSKHFLKKIPKRDTIILTTARDNKHKEHTEKTLEYLGVRYDNVIYDLRSGARILVNDVKPKGAVKNRHEIKTAFAINLKRDQGLQREHLDEYLRV